MTARELEKIAAEQGARVVVPSEPTNEMLLAGLILRYNAKPDTPMSAFAVSESIELGNIYKAMIAARPQCNAEDGLQISRAEHYQNVATAAELLAALEELVAIDDGDQPSLWSCQEPFDNARALIARIRGGQK